MPRFEIDKRYMIKDSTDKMTVVIFESLTEKVIDGSCYGFVNVRVQGWFDELVLKNNFNYINISESNDEVNKKW